MQGTSDLTVFIDLMRGSIPLREDTFYFVPELKRSWLSCFDMEPELENKKEKMDKFFTLIRCSCRGEKKRKIRGANDSCCKAEDGLTLRSSGKRGRSSGQAQGASRGRHSYRDIAHCDVSSYFWLIRAIMSPALIYVVIPPQQSCIDRS